MYGGTEYITPPPTAPLLPAYRSTTSSQHYPHIGTLASPMLAKSTARVNRRPLQPKKREKGRVTTTDSSWNWGGYSETHPYVMEDTSSSVVAVEDGGKEAPSYKGAQRKPEDELLRHRRPTIAPPPPQHVDERIFFNEASPASNVSRTHQRRRSKTFHSTSPPPFLEAVNPKSRSETSVIAPKQKSKLTLHQFQLLVTESHYVEHDVDTSEDCHSRRTVITANGFDPHTHRHAVQGSDSIYSPSTVGSRHRNIEPPSPASFYSASSSPHSDPGYDSDSDINLNLKHAKEEQDDTGFDSDAELTLPAFYRNPLASTSDETLGTIGSIGTIGTMGTMDTMGAALRSLAPETRPTIPALRPKTARGRGGEPELRTDEKRLPTAVPQGKATGLDATRGGPTVATQQDSTHSSDTNRAVQAPLRGVLRPKRVLPMETPSTLALSPNLVGLPTPSIPATATTPRPHSSAVAAHKALVHGNADAEAPPPVASVATQGPPPPRPPRRVHRVPPPLVLAPPSTSSLKNLETNLGLTPRSASSFRFQFQPPPTPLSPALSIMSTMSTLSTVSTIAAVMLNRPKTKEPRMSEKELRRRRFLKLTKTLGEDVPPELVQVKVAIPKRARTMSFGSSKSKGSKRDSVFGDGKSGTRMRKKRKDSFDGRRTLGAGRRSVAVSPLLDSKFPSIPEGYADNSAYDALLSPISTVSPISPIVPPSPNVLRKYPSLRRRSNSNPAGRPTSDQFMRGSINPTPIMSPHIEEKPALATPYFENHPFRLVVEDSSPVPKPSIPRFVKDNAPDSDMRAQAPSGLATESYGKAKRDSSDSMQNPWMRESLSLPLASDTPFIEYALPCGVTRRPSQMRHHRRTSSLDAVSPRRISTFQPSYSDFDHTDGLNVYLNERAGSFGELRSQMTYLGVPEEYDEDDEGQWENIEGGVYRKERRQGWSGEWNQPHIQDVIDKLRQL